MTWLIVIAVGLACLAAGFFFGTAYGVSMEERRNEEVQRHLRRLRREGVIGDGDYR